jgi:hypothetical protein
MIPTLGSKYRKLITTLCIPALFGSNPVAADDTRFVPLDTRGQTLFGAPPTDISWPCVLDRTTGLVWEAKSIATGLHHRHNTYSWFNPNPALNSGHSGQPGDPASQPTDTHAFVRAVNASGWCGRHNWRLPRREELRTLVDYTVLYPGPILNHRAFPNAMAQFYWSAESTVDNAAEAWGIGFAFGFDYAYYKSNRVHVRLVSDSRKKPEPTPAPSCNPATGHIFRVNDDATVTDTRTGLVWARCSLGQESKGDTCQGEPKPLLWSIAALYANSIIDNGWRLPEVQELSALVELRCAQPAIDIDRFPATPAAAYWTATRFANHDGSFWQVQFFLGEVLPEKSDTPAYVRLVRDP